jgi:hypothetical protein
LPGKQKAFSEPNVQGHQPRQIKTNNVRPGKGVPAAPRRNRFGFPSVAAQRPEEFDMARTRKPATSRRTTSRRRSGPAKKSARKTAGKRSSSRRWSQRVTQESDALDLKRGVFTQRDPKRIAASLKRSAERSSRRKTNAYRSALSMLTFYVNRAGKTLPKTQRARLERAKVELKRQFGRA